ncbi:hypothetical protein SLE2022_026470 [Rubroshorea leprosula]
MTLHKCLCPRNSEFSFSKHVTSRAAALGHQICFRSKVCAFGQKHHLSYVTQPSWVTNFRRMAWAIRSNVDGNTFDPSSTNNGRTRLIRTILEIRSKISTRIQELRKNLPMKLLFFLVGFYCATAFATVIGQTGDWDILSAALAAVVVEGIGALMYKASIRVVGKVRSLIIMFNYWKAGLTLGLFLDSFKYEMDNFMGLSNLLDIEIDIFPTFF